jgi:multidrug efflux pump subunit AcrB
MVPLGFAYVISLAASLLVAITVTPVLAALFLPARKSSARMSNRASSMPARDYRRVLDPRHPLASW